MWKRRMWLGGVQWDCVIWVVGKRAVSPAREAGLGDKAVYVRKMHSALDMLEAPMGRVDGNSTERSKTRKWI